METGKVIIPALNVVKWIDVFMLKNHKMAVVKSFNRSGDLRKRKALVVNEIQEPFLGFNWVLVKSILWRFS